MIDDDDGDDDDGDDDDDDDEEWWRSRIWPAQGKKSGELFHLKVSRWYYSYEC